MGNGIVFLLEGSVDVLHLDLDGRSGAVLPGTAVEDESADAYRHLLRADRVARHDRLDGAPSDHAEKRRRPPATSARADNSTGRFFRSSNALTSERFATRAAWTDSVLTLARRSRRQ
jgi:hypothetical protein